MVKLAMLLTFVSERRAAAGAAGAKPKPVASAISSSDLRSVSVRALARSSSGSAQLASRLNRARALASVIRLVSHLVLLPARYTLAVLCATALCLCHLNLARCSPALSCRAAALRITEFHTGITERAQLGHQTSGAHRETARYSITSSVRASTVGGTVRPSALAVLRFSASPYFVATCTGRSAAFSPFKIR